MMTVSVGYPLHNAWGVEVVNPPRPEQALTVGAGLAPLPPSGGNFGLGLSPLPLSGGALKPKSEPPLETVKSILKKLASRESKY